MPKEIKIPISEPKKIENMFQVCKDLSRIIPHEAGRILNLQKSHNRIFLCQYLSSSSVKKQFKIIIPQLVNNDSKIVENVSFIDSIR